MFHDREMWVEVLKHESRCLVFNGVEDVEVYKKETEMLLREV